MLLRYDSENFGKAFTAFRRYRAASLILVSAVAPALPQEIPPEIPKHFTAAAFGQRFDSLKTVTVAVTSRRPDNPDSARDLEHLRKRVLAFLPRTRFTFVPEDASADLALELIVEPNVRYGMFHYQNAPYVYLTLREKPAGRLVYCAYQRAGVFQSATEQLLVDFKRSTQHTTAAPHDSLEACAQQVLRPR